MNNKMVVVGGLSYEEQVSALKRAVKLRRWLTVSIFINAILLVMVLIASMGN